MAPSHVFSVGSNVFLSNVIKVKGSEAAAYLTIIGTESPVVKSLKEEASSNKIYYGVVPSVSFLKVHFGLPPLLQ